MLLDVVKVNQTKFSSFSDDHTKSSAPPTSTIATAAAVSTRTSRVEGKKQSVQKKKAHNNSKEPRPSTISLKDAMDQVSTQRPYYQKFLNVKNFRFAFRK